MKGKEFGLHFMIDAYLCNGDLLNDKSLIERTMLEVTRLIEMTPLCDPVILNVEPRHITKPEDTGITGFIVFAESHMSIHTFPKKGFFTADVYSCKPFSTEMLEKKLANVFWAGKVEVNEVKRGLGFGNIEFLSSNQN